MTKQMSARQNSIQARQVVRMPDRARKTLFSMHLDVRINCAKSYRRIRLFIAMAFQSESISVVNPSM